MNDQTTVSLSTAEAEYVALSRAAQESTLARAINDWSWNDSQTVILEESQSRKILWLIQGQDKDIRNHYTVFVNVFRMDKCKCSIDQQLIGWVTSGPAPDKTKV